MESREEIKKTFRFGVEFVIVDYEQGSKDRVKAGFGFATIDQADAFVESVFGREKAKEGFGGTTNP